MSETEQGFSDSEFEIIDQIYFLNSFKKIHDEVEPASLEVFKKELLSLIDRGFVKVWRSPSDEIMTFDQKEHAAHLESYSFLATKKGLLAHNTR